MHAVIAEVLAHGAAGIGRQELQRRWLRRGGGDDDGVFHRAVLFQGFDDLGDRRALLADGDVDAVKLAVLVLRRLVDLPLIEDGVDDDGGFAGLAVADDQFALAAADRDQAVDGLEAGLHRLIHRLARDDARRLDLDALALGALDRTLAIDRIAETVDNAAQEATANRHVDDGARPLDGVAFLDVAVVAENHDADVVGFQVQRHAADAAGEFDHLASLDIVEAVNPRDAVADAQHLPDLGDFRLGAEVGDLFLEDRGNFRSPNLHHPIPFIARRNCCSLVRRELSTMREPTLTTSPPSRPGSTRASMETAVPTARRSESDSACFCCSLSSLADTTSAVASPRREANSAKKASIMAGSTNSRRLAATTPAKRRVSSLAPALSSTTANALPCSPRVSTGERTNRVRSALPPIIRAKLRRSSATASNCLASSASAKSAVA